MISLVTKACRFISKTINILYIDKLFEVFYRIIKGVLNKLYDLTIWMFENCIKRFFINKITKQMVEIIKEVSYRFNDYLIGPICKLIRKILPQVSNTTKVRADVAVQDSKIAKIFKNFLSAIKNGLTTIYNWTLVPVCNRGLLPIFNVIGDILVGIIGGFSQKWQTSQEKTPDLLNGR
ncbi:MAG: hypothetical protein HZB76_07430 [Chlamydiae bacterium]|nr:hypothetical protein [Chlamydiota bacterium]